MSLRYLSVCSGVEAASAAFEPLGWKPVGFSEIEPFPSAVLAHRFPQVKNYGDLTRFREWPIEPGTVDLLIGGTPCQSFSVAGLRRGLADPRGNLALTFLALADHLRVPWVVWENVAGVLTSGGGRDFGSLVGALGELGYEWAYRTFNAEHFGVPQRRRRVFLVAHRGDRAGPAQVLFEREGVRGNPREAEAQVPSGATWWNGDRVSQTLDAVLAKGQMMPEKNRFPVVAVESSGLLEAEPAKAVLAHLRAVGRSTAPAGRTLRRITPREAERLMGFPDDWTLVPWRGKAASDTVRYKALGNSFAVPVVRWIGERITAVNAR
jgi:DNA (cytosine-5)-methyltransferase 1